MSSFFICGIESFAGTHDFLGGQLWGWYGKDGNTSTNRTGFENKASGVTTGVAIQNANRNGIIGIPLNQVRFYGTATNVQDYSDWLISNNKFMIPNSTNSTGVYSAVHQADFVGRPPLILGGNASSGGTCWLCYSHSSYSAEVPSQFLVNGKGQYIDEKGKIVSKKDRVTNDYFDEYKQKWGNKNSTNLSLPILVPSSKSQEVIKYEKDPF